MEQSKKKYSETNIFKLFNKVSLIYDRVPRLFSKHSFVRSKKLFVKASFAMANNQYYLKLKYPNNLHYKVTLRHFCDLGTSGVIYLKFYADFPETLYLDFHTVIPFKKSTIEINTLPFHKIYSSALKEEFEYNDKSYELNSKDFDFLLKFQKKHNLNSHNEINFDSNHYPNLKSRNFVLGLGVKKLKEQNYSLTIKEDQLINNNNILWNMKIKV